MDEALLPEDREVQEKLAQLEKQAHLGAMFEDWMRHYAGQMFARYLEDQITDAKNKWLSLPDDQALAIRNQTQVYQKIKQWIAAQIATGKVSAMELKKFSEEGEKLEGLIIDQSSKGRPE